MEWPPFYKTAAGEKFFAKRVPELIRAIERLADAVERLAPKMSEETDPEDGR